MRPPQHEKMLVLGDAKADDQLVDLEDELGENSPWPQDLELAGYEGSQRHETEHMAGLLIERLNLFTDKLKQETVTARLPRLLIARKREKYFVHDEEVDGIAHETDSIYSRSKLVLYKKLYGGSFNAYTVAWRSAVDAETLGPNAEVFLNITSTVARDRRIVRRSAAIETVHGRTETEIKFANSEVSTEDDDPARSTDAAKLLSEPMSERYGSSKYIDYYGNTEFNNNIMAMEELDSLMSEVWQRLDDIERQAIEKKLARDEPLTPEQLAILQPTSTENRGIKL